MDLIRPTKQHLLFALSIFIVALVILGITLGVREPTLKDYFVQFETKYALNTILLIINAYLLGYFVSLLFPKIQIPRLRFLPKINTIQLPGSLILNSEDKYKEKKVYNKLVRDGIPEYLDSKHVPYKIHIADELEYEAKLFEKLKEEVDEFNASKSIAELADMLEIINAITIYKEFSSFDIDQVKQKKFEERGGFSKKIILEQS
ncbi:nucleoside triphosphate pyrophosphohydrolase [Candidatus Nomurabacteria bacterium]|nr:MAG: nucleoside triphosphate pyrophosphohydrolase [Candidatus Nomurabacteria bacterium]